MITKEEILESLISLYKQRFPDLELDFGKLSLETNLLLTQAFLDENILLYASQVANESLLLTSILPESIELFANMYGYNIKKANPAETVANLYININNIESLSTKIDRNIKFISTVNDVVFVPKYKYVVSFIKPNTVTVYRYNDFGFKEVCDEYSIRKVIINDSEILSLMLQIELIQSQPYIYTYVVTSDDVSNKDFIRIVLDENVILNNNQTASFSNTFMKPFISDFVVYVNTDIIQQSITPATYSDKPTYTILKNNNKYTVVIDNRNKQINVADIIKVYVNVTYGSKGNIPENSLYISDETHVINNINNQKLDVYVQHPEITSGSDPESIESIKYNIMKLIQSNKRLVTKSDYENIRMYMNNSKDYIKTINVIYSESDIIKNEVDVFITLHNKSSNKVVHTNTASKITTEHTNIPQNSKIYALKVTDENQDTVVYLDELTKNELNIDDDLIEFIYISPFDITINTDLMIPKVLYHYSMKYIPIPIEENITNINNIPTYVKVKDLTISYDYDASIHKYKIFNVTLCIDNLNDILKSASTTDIRDLFDFIINLNSPKNSFNLSNDSIDKVDINYENNILNITFKKDITTGYTPGEVYNGSITIYNKFGTTYDLSTKVVINNIYMDRDISKFIGVKLKYADNKYTLYNIPLISENDVSDDTANIYQILTYIINDLINIENIKMLTNKINILFSRSYGYIENVRFNNKTNTADIVDIYEILLPIKLQINLKALPVKSEYDIISDIKKLLTRFNNNLSQCNNSIVLGKIEKILYDSLDYIQSCDVYIIDRSGNVIDKNIIYDFNENDVDFNKYVPEINLIDVDKTEINVNYISTTTI